jgi:GTP-binding protein LepA
MEIVRERLEREFDLSLIATAPSVEYEVRTTAGEELLIDNPSDLPPAASIEVIREPYLKCSIITPAEYVGTLMDLCQTRRGELVGMDYLSPERVDLRYRLPLAEVVLDFFDQLKSRTQGYASLDYEPVGYEASDLSKVDILLNGEAVDAFCSIVHKDKAYDYGKRMTDKLREIIPRQQFDIPIQAAIGGRIISRQTIKAYRKDVTAKLYGGDISRKRKVLEKQKAGKRRMKNLGRVEVPSDAFIQALRLED